MRLIAFALLAACNSEQSSSSSSLTRDPGECSDREVHVISIFEAADQTVVLQRPGKHFIVLSAHGATTWHVDVKAGTLEGIYANGDSPQHVTANVPTRIWTETGITGYKYPDRATEALLDLTAIRLKLHATSFHGCYAASKWTIGENMLVTSDCGTYKQYDAVTDCDGDNSCGGGGSGSGSDGSLY